MMFPARKVGSRGRYLVWLLCLGLASASGALASSPQPRPLSAAEESAVGLAVAYLDAGPGAWLDHLSADGPLGILDAAAATAEIGVRAGPPAGARWQLQTPAAGGPEGRAVFAIEFPSGLDETLVVDLVPRGTGWAIDRLHCLAEPWTEATAAPEAAGSGPAASSSASTASAQAGSEPGGGLRLRHALLAALGLIVLLLAAAFAWQRRRSRGASPTMLLLLLCLVAGGLVWACTGTDGGDGSAPEAATQAPATPAMVRLGPLWPLRQRLAVGAPAEELLPLLSAVPADGPLHTAVSLWRAELAMQQTDLSAAAAVIEARPDPDPVPLGSLLRARLAFLRSDPAAASRAYARASTHPDHDGIRLEAADALGTLGESGEMEIGYDQLVAMGSRLPPVYYVATQLAVLTGNEEQAVHRLRLAWQLQPMERGDLLSDTLLAFLVTRPDLFPLFELESPSEPRVRSPQAGRRPLSLPAGAEAWTSGEMLRIDLGPARLSVPGGAVLAPRRTPVVGADGERRRDEEQALARLPELLSETRGVGGLANPRRRNELVATSLALARRNRWQELADLTDVVDSAGLDLVPGELVQLRAAALQRLDRNREARALLIRLAQSDLANRRRDPTALYLLAELMAADGEFDIALQLVRKGDALSPLHHNPQWIGQLEMQQRLAISHAAVETEHFRLSYPRITGDKYARQLGIVLEEEYQRLSRWIPATPGPRIEVELYPLLEFLRSYAGAALVVGIYDGIVRVPFADLRSLDPELVAILSHEVGHAMIARASDDRAPRWLHEGLAEHVEMSQTWANPFPDLDATSRTLAFPVLEPILAGFAEPQLIELAYGEAAWVAHYLEARHGVGSFRRLLAAYRDGMDTEQALDSVLGMTPEAFHRAMLQWALEEAPGAWPTKVRRYDLEYDTPFERSPTATPQRRPATFRGDERSRLMEWHRTYVEQIAPFKRALASLADDLAVGQTEGHRQDCAALGRQVTALRLGSRIFDCPLAQVGANLRNAFDRFADMAQACEVGAGTKTLTAYRRAEHDLAAAAETLRPYGINL